MPLKLKPLRKIKTDIVPPPKVGEIVEGKVVATDRSSLFLDLGRQGIGVIYGSELHKARNILKNVKIGDSLSTKLISLENEEGYRELSAIDASKELGWQNLREKREKNQPLEVRISKANKGGLITEVNGITAFLPVSQLAPEHYPKVEDGDAAKIAKALQDFIGQTLKVKIIDLDPKKDKLILSEKAGELLKEEKELEKYKIGDIVEGEVSGLTSFGAFIRLKNGLEGLLYPSELPHQNKKPEEVLKISQKLKVKIIKIADNRVYLSLKNLN